MPRQIIPVEQEENKEQINIQNDSAQETNNTNIPNDEEIIITSQEIEKLFHEWDANGHNDLTINRTLEKRITEYLEYQEKMDPLKKKLAKRIYEAFKSSGNEGRDAELYIDGVFIGYITIYKHKGMYKIMNICDFKMMLIALNNPYAIWITETDGGIDINAYLKSIRRKVEVSWDRDHYDVEVKY